MRFASFAPGVLIGLAVLTAAPAAEIDREFHESFEVGADAVLELDHGDGDVTITPWDKDIIDVQVRYRAKISSHGIGSDPDFDVEFRQDGNRVHVTGKEPAGGTIVGYRSIDEYIHTYEIRAPQHVALIVEGEDGDVSIEDWAADVRCDLEDGDLSVSGLHGAKLQVFLEDGDLSVSGLSGELKGSCEDGDVLLSDSEISEGELRLEDGSLVVRGSAGNLKVATEDGDVELDRFRAGNLDLRTSDGDLVVSLLRSDGMDVFVRAEDGRVRLQVESGTSATFALESDDGSIRLDLPSAQDVIRKEHRATGRLHGGDGRIRVETGDGEILFREEN